MVGARRGVHDIAHNQHHQAVVERVMNKTLEILEKQNGAVGQIVQVRSLSSGAEIIFLDVRIFLNVFC